MTCERLKILVSHHAMRMNSHRIFFPGYRSMHARQFYRPEIFWIKLLCLKVKKAKSDIDKTHSCEIRRWNLFSIGKLFEMFKNAVPLTKNHQVASGNFNI